MPIVALKAHYDGERIVLDDAYDLPMHAPLMVIVLPAATHPDSDTEEAWLRNAAANGAFDFLADPSEDIYTLQDGEAVPNAV